MPSIKHIVFPVDFSECSASAVPFVAETARRYDAKITLIAVASPTYVGGFEAALATDPQTILDDLKSQLDGAYIKDFAGLKVDRMAILGDPAHVIADFVAANKVDLVMMPTHGYGPFRRLLLGSVTAKVLHEVHVPVWTMAHTDEAPHHSDLDMHTVVCAVDATRASIELMRWAAGLCEKLGATLRLVHAVPGIDAWPERPLDHEFQETLRDNARRNIEELEKAAHIDVPVCVGVGSVSDVVREEALQHGADLVLIGRGALQETMGRLRTHSYGIIRQAPCPVLSVCSENQP